MRDGRQEKPLIAAPDVVTALRLPLAAAFVLLSAPWLRLGVLATAALSDMVDGIWARRRGGSRIGTVLDPICDKVFMVVAFWVVWSSDALSIWEVAAVLLRDVVAFVGLATVTVLGRPTTLPARAGGKAVTVAQMLVLVAFVAGSRFTVPLAWAAGAISVYAIADYSRVYKKKDSTVRGSDR